MPFEYIDQYFGMGFRVGCVINTMQFPLHFHNGFEILYSLKGSAVTVIGNKRVTFHKGECVIVNPSTVHTILTSVDENPDIIYLNITPSFCSTYCPQFAQYEITQNLIAEAEHAGFLQTIRDFFRVYYSEAFHPNAGTRLRLMSLLTNICRQMMTDLPNQKRIHALSIEQSAKQKRLVEISDFIFEKHTSNITLSETAKHFGLNPSYLSRFIHENLGVSFQKYLTKTRLDHAMWLIVYNPHMSLASICYKSGFSAQKYFRASFEEFFHCSPDEYQERCLKAMDEQLDTATLQNNDIYSFSFPFIGYYDTQIPFINIHGHGRSSAYILSML